MTSTTERYQADVTQGRGAWSKVGKPNGQRSYTYVKPGEDGKPAVDGRELTDDNHRAVHLAVRHSVQPAVGIPAAECDGRLGPATHAAITRWQEAQGLTADGQFGPRSAAAAFRPLVEDAARAHGIPAAHLHGIVSHESGYDPGAVGYLTPADRGLAQVNLEHHGPGTGDNFTPAQLHTAAWAITYNAQRLASARRYFSGKGEDLRTRCALLEHNNPVNAHHLFRTGEYRTDQARQYVEAVLRAVGSY